MVKFYTAYLEISSKENNLILSTKDKERDKDKERNAGGSSGKTLKKSIRYATKDKELGSVLFTSSNANNTSYNKKYKSTMIHAAKEVKEQNNNICNLNRYSCGWWIVWYVV